MTFIINGANILPIIPGRWRWLDLWPGHSDPIQWRRIIRRYMMFAEIRPVFIQDLPPLLSFGDLLISKHISRRKTKCRRTGHLIRQGKIIYLHQQRHFSLVVCCQKFNFASIQSSWYIPRRLDSNPNRLILICLNIDVLQNRRQRIRPTP